MSDLIERLEAAAKRAQSACDWWDNTECASDTAREFSQEYGNDVKAIREAITLLAAQKSSAAA